MDNLLKQTKPKYQSVIYARELYVECPHCASENEVFTTLLGGEIKSCNSCGEVFKIPYYAKIQPRK